MNRLFVVNKPIFCSSNGYMNLMKYKYNRKKIGFSGTLDPFASGTLIVAIGQYTKLFNYLKKTPKTYRATLWLGANSSSLDIENIDSIKDTEEFERDRVESILESLKGELSYYPPKFSAKKIGGVRAYHLARNGDEVELKKITSTIHDIKLINYNHPFIHFEATVSEGTYIRSLGALIADELGVDGTLSSLHRVNEGEFFYDNEKAINPFNHLDMPRNRHLGDDDYVELGKKLYIDYFEIKSNGLYLVETPNYFAIIEIIDGIVKYRLNKIHKFEG